MVRNRRLVGRDHVTGALKENCLIMTLSTLLISAVTYSDGVEVQAVVRRTVARNLSVNRELLLFRFNLQCENCDKKSKN